jgi:hypothetical protein
VREWFRFVYSGGSRVGARRLGHPAGGRGPGNGRGGETAPRRAVAARAGAPTARRETSHSAAVALRLTPARPLREDAHDLGDEVVDVSPSPKMLIPRIIPRKISAPMKGSTPRAAVLSRPPAPPAPARRSGRGIPSVRLGGTKVTLVAVKQHEKRALVPEERASRARSAQALRGIGLRGSEAESSVCNRSSLEDRRVEIPVRKQR